MAAAMADDTPPSQPRTDRGGRSGGDRPAGNREPGGFRIRLSDNEMRAAQAIQESFGLRSTVAALGFAIRTVAQLLEEGQLEGLVAQQRAQGDRPPGDRAPGERSQGERRSGAGDGRLSRQEARSFPWLYRRFSEIDLNRDGAVSLQEVWESRKSLAPRP